MSKQYPFMFCFQGGPEAQWPDDKKEARMKTNKKKATNFYSTANVKNKNREKAAVMKTLQSGDKSGRKRRR